MGSLFYVSDHSGHRWIVLATSELDAKQKVCSIHACVNPDNLRVMKSNADCIEVLNNTFAVA
jgi:hypothetical protein